MSTTTLGGAPRPAVLVDDPAFTRAREGAPHRFTLDGSDELEAHLTRTCAKIAAGLRGLIPERKLEAVLLGGGYGRGEGGVLRTPAGDRPYNDLEFYVGLRGNRHVNEQLHGRALHVLGEILTPQAGVDVEFKIASLPEIAAGSVSMFSYDLVCGHRWLIGDESRLAGCAHHRHADAIPLGEATRLLMNRGSGLLFARERLRRHTFTAGDADFTARNIAKAELALGDAVLTAHGQYHWSVRERQRRLLHLAQLEDSAWMREICRHYAGGVQFKLHPTRSHATREELEALHERVVELARPTFLWLEQRRLHQRFASAEDYILRAHHLCPESPPARNVAINLKVLGPRHAFASAPLQHPRERVLRAMALLLWMPDAAATPHFQEWLQRALCTGATDFGGFMAAYRAIWEHVN